MNISRFRIILKNCALILKPYLAIFYQFMKKYSQFTEQSIVLYSTDLYR